MYAPIRIIVMKINEYIKQIVKGINSNFSDLINNDYR